MTGSESIRKPGKSGTSCGYANLAWAFYELYARERLRYVCNHCDDYELDRLLLDMPVTSILLNCTMIMVPIGLRCINKMQ